MLPRNPRWRLTCRRRNLKQWRRSVRKNDGRRTKPCKCSKPNTLGRGGHVGRGA